MYLNLSHFSFRIGGAGFKYHESHYKSGSFDNLKNYICVICKSLKFLIMFSRSYVDDFIHIQYCQFILMKSLAVFDTLKLKCILDPFIRQVYQYFGHHYNLVLRRCRKKIGSKGNPPLTRFLFSWFDWLLPKQEKPECKTQIISRSTNLW